MKSKTIIIHIFAFLINPPDGRNTYFAEAINEASVEVEGKANSRLNDNIAGVSSSKNDAAHSPIHSHNDMLSNDSVKTITNSRDVGSRSGQPPFRKTVRRKARVSSSILERRHQSTSTSTSTSISQHQHQHQQ